MKLNAFIINFRWSKKSHKILKKTLKGWIKRMVSRRKKSLLPLMKMGRSHLLRREIPPSPFIINRAPRAPSFVFAVWIPRLLTAFAYIKIRPFRA